MQSGPTGLRKGLVLLVVVGVLGILVVLGVAFVTLARLERHASEQRLNATKALLLARSGLEDALARLSAGQDALLPSNAYAGEDLDADGILSPLEAQQQLYQVTPPGTPADTADCPLQHALRPSFFARVPLSTLPAVEKVDGRLRGFSGRLAGDQAPAGNLYVLKVEDESAKIQVNGGFLDARDRDNDGIPDHRDPDVRLNPADPKDTGMGWNFQLARILNVLGSQPEVLGPAFPTLGTLAIQNRPPGGYRSIRQLQSALGVAKDLSPWLTVSGWTDPKVVHPNAYAAQATGISVNDLKLGRGPLALEENGRSPVNLNAAPRPVLVALLQDLQGISWKETRTPVPYSMSPAMASDIAQAILDRRALKPFDTWSDFSAFCDALTSDITVPAGPVIRGLDTVPFSGGNACGADLLKTNFDPNTHLNKQLPDQLMWRWIDKSDLTVWSTEGNLGPTGTFTVSALGRVLDRNGKLLARATAQATCEVFSLLRQTTQQDFVAGRSSLASYLSVSNGAMLRTTGASAGSAWWGGAPPVDGAGQPVGLGAVTYPAPPAALPGQAADVDGAVALASVETSPLDPLNGSLLFLHHFNADRSGVKGPWDADKGVIARISPDNTALPSDNLLLADPYDPAQRGVWPSPPQEANIFCPDGLQAQLGRSPAYNAVGNFPVSWTGADPAPSNHGVISYWMKPVLLRPSNPMAFITEDACHFACVRYTPVETQALIMGNNGGLWGVLAENKVYPAGDTNSIGLAYERSHELRYDNGDILMPGARWQLMTALLDTDVQDCGPFARDLHLDIRALRMGPADGVVYSPWYENLYATTEGEDLVQPGVAFVIGVPRTLGTLKLANQVVDEFALCDFGDDPLHNGQALNNSTLWAADRYREGRYYKGDDGAFLSEALQATPRGPARLLSAQWTGYLPRESRLENLGFSPGVTTARRIDPVLADAPSGSPRAWIEVDLLDAAAGLQTPGTALTPGATLHAQAAQARFRYRARFRTRPVDPLTGLPDPLGQPLLETPWLDDITFAWQPAAGPRVLSWERQ